MAIAFELVADFNADKESADSFRQWITKRILPITIDQYAINLHTPFVSGYPYNNPTKFQVSIVPANVGCGVALDETNDRLPLNESQLSRLGTFLYDLLRGAPRYQLAMVGWDVDFLLDIDELATEWASEISDGSFAGLVVENSLLPRLPASEYFTYFDPTHVWLPYKGSDVIA